MADKPELFDDLPTQLAPISVLQAGVNPVWTEHKAGLIARYLRYFVFITKHGAYIDGFAGPKSIEVPDSWAAQLVLSSEPKFLKQFFLCEIDPTKIQQLKQVSDSQPDEPKRTIRLYEGDFNSKVDQILQSGDITDKTATFCLLDQFTCECHWAILQKLADHKSPGERKIELFYFFGNWLAWTFSQRIYCKRSGTRKMVGQSGLEQVERAKWR